MGRGQETREVKAGPEASAALWAVTIREDLDACPVRRNSLRASGGDRSPQTFSSRSVRSR